MRRWSITDIHSNILLPTTLLMLANIQLWERSLQSFVQRALFEGPGSIVYNRIIPRLTVRFHQQVVDEVGLFLPGGIVLDVGTGPGHLVLRMAEQLPNLMVWGVDVSADMITLAQENAHRSGLGDRVHFEVSTATRIPVADHSVDMAVSTLSMHHWQNLEAMLDELARVLRPQGQLWIYDFQVNAPGVHDLTYAVQPLPLSKPQVKRINIRFGGMLPMPTILRYSMNRL